MVIVECQTCNNRQQTTAAAIIDGIACQKCGKTMRLDDGSGKRVHETDDKLIQEKCPRCMMEIPCSSSDTMPLVWCPVCKIAFIRMRLREFSSHRSSWDTEKIFQVIESNHREKLGWATVDRTEAQQVRVLKGLDIQNSEIAPEIAKPVIQGIFHRAEQELERHYRNLRRLPEDLQIQMAMAMAKSELLNVFYIQNQPVDELYLEPVIKSVLKDNFMYPILSRDLDKRSLALVGAYIYEFGRSVYHLDLPKAMIEYLVMKAFACGIAGEIRDSEYFLYYPETGQVRATTDLNVNGRKIFYVKDDEINIHLDRIFSEAGYQPAKRRLGCMPLLLMLTPLSALALWFCR